VGRADSLNTHIHLKPSLKISGAIPPLNLPPSMAHIGTSSFYPNHLPLYISLKRSHSFWSYKGTFLYITYPLHSHYMTHLFHLYWSNYIHIINSSNNKPQYIIFCVLLLLIPSIDQISMNVGPCHHGMARPQVADGGTASNMEGRRE
jgi:hypothetical protein